MPIVELVDTTRWRVATHNVSELDIGRVRKGQEAVVRVIVLGDQVLRERVLVVSAVADIIESLCGHSFTRFPAGSLRKIDAPKPGRDKVLRKVLVSR